MGSFEYKEYSSLMMNHSGSIGYICDADTHELIYLSNACMNAFGAKTQDDYRGRKCYEFLQDRTEPCPSCVLKLSKESKYNWEHYNPRLEKWFDKTGSLIDVDGRTCRLVLSRDITARKEKLMELTGQLSLEKVLFQCLNTLTKEHETGDAFNNLLHLVGEYYKASRAYIIEFHLDAHLFDNTFEWCSPGVPPKIDSSQGLPLSMLERWMKDLRTVGEFSVRALSEVIEPGAEDYLSLVRHFVESLMAVPLIRDGKIIGLLGVDDPGEHFGDSSLLHAVSGFLTEELERRRLLAELEGMSYTDSLTLLQNRNSYTRVLHKYEIAPPNSLGIIVLDINGLKTINDIYGLEYGDQVLRRVGDILRKQLPYQAYRIGGDEFTALCENVTKDDFQQQVMHLHDAFNADSLCDVSIGFAWDNNADSMDINSLRHQAHEVRHAEKRSYYYDLLRGGQPLIHRGVVGEVLNDIATGRFTVYYQPQIDIQTGTIVGAEALVRKYSEDGTVIPPGKFIHFYEMSGVISHLDLFVLRTACTALHQWHEQGHDLHISVNFSRVTLLDPYIVDIIRDICLEENISPSFVTIEVTESIGKMDTEYLKELISKLKEVGFSISLDDFGSQYSNLAILAAMDFDEVKFDRSLVSTLEENKKSRLVIESGLGLCHAMEGTASLAEGIETSGQLELLASYHCDYGQGYYFSRPLPLDQFNDYMNKHS